MNPFPFSLRAVFRGRAAGGFMKFARKMAGICKIDAINASETSTSALISNAVISPITASVTIGSPQNAIAIHAQSNGNG